MKPGRDMDALVAEEIMGQTVVYMEPPPRRIPHGIQDKNGNVVDLPKYSTDMGAAAQVKMKANIGSVIWMSEGQVMATLPDGSTVVGETEPHAICSAALNAAGVQM